LGHATDMAQHNYFEHEDLAGRSPADRVRRDGHRLCDGSGFEAWFVLGSIAGRSLTAEKWDSVKPLCGVDSFCRKRSPIEWTRQAPREPSLFRVKCSFGGGG
jgi:hypothetical protein